MLLKSFSSKSILCVGHVCHDKVNGKVLLGGAVSFMAFLLSRYGNEVSILSSYGNDFKYEHFLKELDIIMHNQYSGKTTHFENIYKGEDRKQYIGPVAREINLSLIDSTEYDLIVFAPIADEFNLSGLKKKKADFWVACPQGFLREWDDSGLVSNKTIDWGKLSGMDLIILSEMDLKNREEDIKELQQQCNHIVVTRGSLPTIVYSDNKKYFSNTRHTEIRTRTGAGDLYAAAYILAYYTFKEIDIALNFALISTSLCIEQERFENYPKLDEVLLGMSSLN